MNQGHRHREEQEKLELEKAANMLETLAKRKKMLDNYEKKKKKAAAATEEKNFEKLEMTNR